MSAFDTPTPANAAGQQWNAQDYAIDAGFVPLLGGAVSSLLDPRAGERILDLGCGDGVLSTELALSGARIHGVDASPELVIAARARGVDAQVMDGHALSFDGEFDAVFSNAALHWMTTPDRVLEGVRRALRPAGASSPSSAAMATWSRSSPQCRPRVQRMAMVPARSSGPHGRRLRRPPAPAWLPRAADRMHAAPDRAANRRGRLAAGFRCAAARRSAGRGPLDRARSRQRAAGRPAAQCRRQPLADYVRLRVLARRR